MPETEMTSGLLQPSGGVMAKDKATPPRLIEKWMKRWASLDFRPKKELTGCPQCGSKLRPFVEPGCYDEVHKWHARRRRSNVSDKAEGL
jgi:hypothetical protein